MYICAMLVNTQGVVLKTTNYTESSIIAQIYTKDYGTISCMVNGARKPKAKIPQALLQPFHLLDIVIYHKKGSEIHRLSEAKQATILQNIPFDIGKRAIVLFLNEITYKTLAKHDADELIFDFLFHAIQYLDICDPKTTSNFHLTFLAQLSRYLGFAPDVTNFNTNSLYFDLVDGVFSHTLPFHPEHIQKPYTDYWKSIFEAKWDNDTNLSLSRNDRKIMLETMIKFYSLHVHHLGVLKSIKVLEEIFE